MLSFQKKGVEEYQKERFAILYGHGYLFAYSQRLQNGLNKAVFETPELDREQAVKAWHAGFQDGTLDKRHGWEPPKSIDEFFVEEQVVEVVE